MTLMPVPTYDKFIDPLLRFLAAQTVPIATREACEAVASALGLDEEQRQETVSSGQQVYRNRAGWAHDRLKRAGYSTSPRRGYWQLTPDGMSFSTLAPCPLPDAEVQRIAFEALDVRLRPVDEIAESSRAAPIQPTQSVQSPDDRLDQALSEIKQSVAGDLLDQLRSVTPQFFEEVVLDVLHAVGYGANRSDLQRVGGSGDSGIDGIISLDRLGLERVYVQAKRWKDSVGRPEIQAFFGALAGQRATKGVFITTSSFSQQALHYAASVGHVVLVDGLKLTELMIDHGVGVSVRAVHIPKVDSDYFEDGT